MVNGTSSPLKASPDKIKQMLSILSLFRTPVYVQILSATVGLSFISVVTASKERTAANSIDGSCPYCYSLAINRPENQIETAAMSITGIRTAQILSFISCIACSTIIYIVLRSGFAEGRRRRQRRGGRGLLGGSCIAFRLRQYNRLVLGLGIGGLLSSFARLLTTWTIPLDTIYSGISGSKYGSFSLCSTQGALFLFGRSLSALYIMTLCLYYSCSICGAGAGAEGGFGAVFREEEGGGQQQQQQQQQQRQISPQQILGKWTEIILHLVCVSLSTVITVEALRVDILSPNPFQPLCSVKAYPYYCSLENSHNQYEECTERDRESFVKFRVVGLSISVPVTIISLACMIRICSTALAQKREMSKGIERLTRIGGRRVQFARRSSDYNDLVVRIRGQITSLNVVMVQASGFVFLLIFTQMTFLILFLLSADDNITVQYFAIILQSSRGLCLFMLVIIDKLYNYSRSDASMTWWGAFCEVLRNPQNEPVFYFTNLTLIEGTDGVNSGESSARDSIELEPHLVQVPARGGIHIEEVLNSPNNYIHHIHHNIITVSETKGRESSESALAQNDSSSSFHLSHDFSCGEQSADSSCHEQ